MIYNPETAGGGGGCSWREVDWPGFSEFISTHSSPDNGFGTGVIFLQHDDFFEGFMPIAVRTDLTFNTSADSWIVVNSTLTGNVVLKPNGNAGSLNVEVGGNIVLNYNSITDDAPTFLAGWSARYFIFEE